MIVVPNMLVLKVGEKLPRALNSQRFNKTQRMRCSCLGQAMEVAASAKALGQESFWNI